MGYFNTKWILSGLMMVGFFILFMPNSALGSGHLMNVLDGDMDGLPDIDEQNIYFTDAKNSDTDGDGFLDGEEIQNGYSPRHGNGVRLISADSDKDYLNDAWELKIGTSIMDPDFDGDLYLDGTEVKAGYTPFSTAKRKFDKSIKVSIEDQHLWYYFGNILLEDFPISGGLQYTPTPVGEFAVLDKVPTKNYGGIGYNFSYPDTKWNLHFTTDYWRYYIHGTYWHDNFGSPMSHGCVNVSYDNMERLYWFAQVGTKVSVT